MDKSKYAVIGGDLRSVKLANLIKEDGLDVRLYGFNNAGFDIGQEEKESLKSTIQGVNIVVGPIPCTTDDDTINAPFNLTKIFIEELFKQMSQDQIFIAGRISPHIRTIANGYNIQVIDLLEREEMAVLNAIPTAEGAIQLAMEETPITLHNSKVLVLGYGRVGKILAKMLRGIGADVYVGARKYEDIALIRSYCYKPVNIRQLHKYLGEMDVVFNTVPHVILNYELLKLINPNTLIIDLASKPGGVDFESAKALGVRTIWALSLPGKVAPVSAGQFIKETVYNIVNDLGV